MIKDKTKQLSPASKGHKYLKFLDTARHSPPSSFNDPFTNATTIHPLSLAAVEELQSYLRDQDDWVHNFGLVEGKEGPVIGKMFGVLLVELPDQRIAYLSAFSGKLAGSNNHEHFVPPVFDSLEEGGFLNEGMKALKVLSNEITEIEEGSKTSPDSDLTKQLQQLKEKRKEHSAALQDKLFDSYHFINHRQEKKSLKDIFRSTRNIKPPSGAGECAAPKLLQYAFSEGMKPLYISEFWWGLSPKSDQWKHRHFYPVCREKCEPILAHMLVGMDVENP